MWRSSLALAVLGCAGAGWSGVAQAATFNVTSLDNAGPGSLRAALDAANAAPGADAIGFAVTGTIALTTAELTITDDVTLTGPGLASLTVSGENARRVFSVGANVTATVSGLTIANGRVAAAGGVAAPASGGAGGAGGGNGGAGANINVSVAATDGGAGVRNAGNLVLRDVRLVANTVIAGRGGDATATAGSGGAGTATAGGIGGNASATGGSGGAGQGGAILNTGTLLVERATITANTVTAGSAGTAIAGGGPGGDGGFGGGPGGIGGDATATAGSGGPARGGAISNAGSLTLRETSLTANVVTAGAGSTRQSTGGNGGTAAAGSGAFGGDAVAPAGSTAGSASGAAIHNGGTVTVETSTIAGNRVLAGAGGSATASGGDGGQGGSPGSGGDGGTATTAAGTGGVALAAAILNDGVNLRIYNTTIVDNSAVNGTAGPAQATSGSAGGGAGGSGGNATVAANAGGAAGGGGVTNLAGRTVTLASATITGNSAPIGANLTNVGTATAINTIVADGIGGGASCAGTITSRGFNLDDGTTCGFTQPTDQSSVDARLGALGDNGGPTRTRVPQAGSPAIERGTSDGFRTDQRGLARPFDLTDVPTGAGDGSDIGAVEVQPLPAPAAPGSPAPGPAAGPDTVAPSLLAARLSPKSFVVGSRGSALVYTISESARVRFTIARRTGGRRVSTACRKQTKANRSRRSCVRYVTVATLTQSANAGANTQRLPSRPAGRRLAAGRYRITILATDAAGNRSAPKRLTFTVVRR